MLEEKFFGENYHFVLSDNWCIDGDEIWFIASTMDLLFCMDRKTNKATVVSEIPVDKVCAFRQHPICKKYKDSIFCLPYLGEDIWCYHVSDCSWTRISVKKTVGVGIACYNAWIIQDKLYIVSNGLKQIIEVDLSTERVENYYTLLNGDGNITGSVLVGDCIYVAAFCQQNYICKFNCTSKALQIFLLSEINDQIHTICFDGNKFWLSGRCRSIYIWSEEERKVVIRNNFPKDFGIYNFSGKYENALNYNQDSIDTPLFFSSVYSGKYVWFIPFQANEILYIDKETQEIGIFPLGNEMQTKEDMKMQLLPHKYLLEYAKDSCFGLFSLKNKWVLEIDCQRLEYKVLDCRLEEENVPYLDNCILSDMFKRSTIYEQERFCVNDFLIGVLGSRSQISQKLEGKNKNGKDSMAKDIYINIKEELGHR